VGLSPRPAPPTKARGGDKVCLLTLLE
jgi:hypothetical protein